MYGPAKVLLINGGSAMSRLQNLLNVSSVRVQGSVAATGHQTGVLLLLPLPALPALLPDGAAEHAVAALDVRGHDPLDSPKHLAHT